MSHADATLPASSTPIVGYIDDNVLAGWQREKEEQREQRNARRRATYRKKKDEQVKLQNEKQTVSRPPLGDITNIDQPSVSMPGTGV